MTREPDVTGDDVTATVLSFNSWDTLAEVLQGLKSQTVPPGRVIVVDNASSDGSLERLRELDWVEVIALEENRGVGYGHNLGIEAAIDEPTCSYVWVLEHDSMATPTCLEELLRAERALAREGRLVGALQPTRTRASEDLPPKDRMDPHDRTILTFNGSLFPSCVLREVGALREDFFVGLEDSEFADRLRSAGYEILAAPSSLLFHESIGLKRRGVRRSITRSFYSTRNSVFLEVHLRRHPLARSMAVLRALLGSVRSLLFEDEKWARVCSRLVATHDGLLGRMGRQDYWFLSSR